MTPREAHIASEKLDVYYKLAKRRGELSHVIDQLTCNREDDPNKTGPFTGNHRESRRIDLLHIEFSATRGRSPAVEITLNNLGIPAYEFQKALIIMVRTAIDEVIKEMDKI